MTRRPSLDRRLGTFDAVVVGLGAMVGAGVFTAIGAAADAAGPAMLVGLAIAGAVAYCNATSSAQLAAMYPEAGGTYVYGRERLGPFWGVLAGWCFVVGKVASLTAMALTVGAYAWPDAERIVAVMSVVAMTSVNVVGIRKTAIATRAIVAVVVVVLVGVVVVSLSGSPSLERFEPFVGGDGWVGVLRSAGLLFFAFAGYARIATLGEEVHDPERTIPRAIPLALAIVVALYALVSAAALAAVGAPGLGSAAAPLAEAAAAVGWFGPVIRTGAAVAALGVLLSLLAGVSRTVLAMARDRVLPASLARVDARFRTPAVAELAVAALVVALVLLVDVRGAIGFSSFTVLLYYAIANASAFTQPRQHRRWPRALQVAGVAGCVVLAVSLPLASVVSGAAIAAAGALVWTVRGRVGPRR